MLVRLDGDSVLKQRSKPILFTMGSEAVVNVKSFRAASSYNYNIVISSIFQLPTWFGRYAHNGHTN